MGREAIPKFGSGGRESSVIVSRLYAGMRHHLEVGSSGSPQSGRGRFRFNKWRGGEFLIVNVEVLVASADLLTEDRSDMFI